MPYSEGEWGKRAKARSKRRLEYFKEYSRRRRERTKGHSSPCVLSGQVDLEALLKRSKGRCEICGRTKFMDIHHINKDTTDNRLDNLKYFCRSCHNRTHEKGRRRRKKENGK